MEPELRKTETQQKSVVNNYQIKKDLKQNIFQKNINKQMLRMNERLKNRRSKSLIGKSKNVKIDKSFNLRMNDNKEEKRNTDIDKKLSLIHI